MAGVGTSGPIFSNVDFNVLPGEPFDLYLNGCDQGCKILSYQQLWYYLHLPALRLMRLAYLPYQQLSNQLQLSALSQKMLMQGAPHQQPEFGVIGPWPRSACRDSDRIGSCCCLNYAWAVFVVAKKKTEGEKQEHNVNDHLQGQTPDLGQPKEPETIVTSMPPAELRGSTPPPPATEMEDTAPLSEIQAKGIKNNTVLESSPGITASELHGENQPLHSELPTETAPHKMESNQQPKESSPPIKKPFTGSAQQQLQTFPQSPSLSIASPDTGVSLLPSALGGTALPSGTETMSPLSQSPDAEISQTRASLMDKYAQLEARRQRLLELKQIEEEQADLEAKLRATTEQGKKSGTIYFTSCCKPSCNESAM
ncbi:hypothetical protein B0J13DRAFT_624165 [Dactylonectria estremocensis]|uniref:Uncharacterized protein n=1 Tax=Dactylonectria estremocensis TaxID=1079267 RepID=A0A9P9EMQ4_9HYPO|nr:hypothetical protein B0J13DRAFT_624165 [Dactylonectria estremocensis]